MSLLELLPKNEISMFDKYRCAYVEDTCGPKADAEEILQYWDSAKSMGNLYHLLNDNFIINKEIVSEKTSYEMEALVENLLYKQGEFLRSWRDLLYSNFIEYKLDETNPVYAMFYKMDKLMSVKSLSTNIYDGETFFVTFLNGDVYKVQKGCKVSKALGKIAEGFCLSGYEEFRIAHSQILNEKKLCGTMSLSIHPLDYVTMSDNNCDWSSCMSWAENGEYRRGTVEMMNSSYVIIAYLNAKDEMCIPGGTWSNKKWRELFIVSKDCISAIKGYPYWNRDLERIALEWIKELAEKNWGYEYTNKTYELDAPNHQTNVFIEELNQDIKFEFYTNAMYNDCYDRHYTYVNKHLDHDITIDYSGVGNCMWCNATRNNFSFEGSLVCTSCDDEIYCVKCGERIYDGDEYCVNGDYYCSYCYNDLPLCDDCEEVITEDYYVTRVYFSKDGKIYRWHYADLCDDCRDNNAHFKKSDIKECVVNGWQHIRYLRAEDMDLNDERTVEYFTSIFHDNVFSDNLTSPYWKIPVKEEEEKDSLLIF